MEFRYRSIDGDRPRTRSDTAPTQSPIQSSSFLSARPTAGSSEDHVREAIIREIEKEQIRQEIIIAETARRRELIAEVVQEMAIEREMALKRVVETGMWINQNELLLNQILNNYLFRQNQNLRNPGPYNLFTSPAMQLSPLEQMPEATRAKNRPAAIGTKRKAEDTQTDHVRAKRKADGVGLARDPNLLGPENKAKEKLMFVETGETVSLKPPSCSGKFGSGKQVESKSKLQFKFWCDICGVGAHSQTVMRSHELGKKHIAAIKQQTAPPETASTSITITPPLQSEAVAVPESANVHDQQKVDETVAKETEEKKKKAKFLCELCNIQTHSEQVMETHRLGRKHKVLLKKQQNELQAVAEDTNVITVPVISLDADPGEQMVEATGVKVTSLMESNKDKLIELNRPDAIGAKRKAEDTQTDNVRAKRKADGVGLARDPNLIGPENKEKEIALKENLMSLQTGETVSSKLPPCSGKLVSGKQEESKSKLMFKFWCDICGVGAYSQTVMRSHELGKKHIAAIKQQNEPPKTASTSIIITPPQQKVDETAAKDEKKKKMRFWCKNCHIQTYPEQVMETHRLGEKHIAAIKQQNEPPKTASTSMSITPPPQSATVAVPENVDVQDQQKVDETIEKKKKLRCELCNTLQYTEQMVETHIGRELTILLKRQQRALKKQQYQQRELMKQQNELQAVAEDTNVITVPVISLDVDL